MQVVLSDEGNVPPQITVIPANRHSADSEIGDLTDVFWPDENIYHATRYGIGEDNPAHPRNMNHHQASKAMMIELNKRSNFRVRFVLVHPKHVLERDDYILRSHTGRNLIFAGYSNIEKHYCPYPSPPPSPSVPPAPSVPPPRPAPPAPPPTLPPPLVPWLCDIEGTQLSLFKSVRASSFRPNARARDRGAKRRSQDGAKAVRQGAHRTLTSVVCRRGAAANGRLQSRWPRWPLRHPTHALCQQPRPTLHE